LFGRHAADPLNSLADDRLQRVAVPLTTRGAPVTVR